MAYYQGDYYAGDYYQGDPFLGLGAIFGAAKWIGKKIFKRGASKVGGAIALQSAGSTAFQIAKRTLPGVAGAAAGSMVFGGRQPQTMFQSGGTIRKTPGVRGTMQRLIPGGESGYECKPGQYAQKKDFQLTGKCLYRKMNVTNSRALRRSLRRVAGFGKLASRARRDIGRAARSVGAVQSRRGPVARHHARIRAKA